MLPEGRAAAAVSGPWGDWPHWSNVCREAIVAHSHPAGRQVVRAARARCQGDLCSARCDSYRGARRESDSGARRDSDSGARRDSGARCQ